MKEFRDGNTEAETEAFDRYMQNIGLLEEVFRVNSALSDEIQNQQLISDGQTTETMVQGLKLKLRSDPVRSDNLRKRTRYVVDQGLRKLGKVELIDGSGDLSDTEGHDNTGKEIKSSHGERLMALVDLSDKLNKSRNKEELKACSEMASQIFRRHTTIEEFPVKGPTYDPCTEQQSCFFLPKSVHQVTIDQEVLCQVGAQFSSLEEIEDL